MHASFHRHTSQFGLLRLLLDLKYSFLHFLRLDRPLNGWIFDFLIVALTQPLRFFRNIIIKPKVASFIHQLMHRQLACSLMQRHKPILTDGLNRYLGLFFGKPYHVFLGRRRLFLDNSVGSHCLNKYYKKAMKNAREGSEIQSFFIYYFGIKQASMDFGKLQYSFHWTLRTKMIFLTVLLLLGSLGRQDMIQVPPLLAYYNNLGQGINVPGLSLGQINISPVARTTNGNSIQGQQNAIRGFGNQIQGDGNKLIGVNNTLIGSSGNIYGLSNNVIGNHNVIQKGNQNIILGLQNILKGNQNSIIGNLNIVSGKQNFLTGSDNLVQGDSNIIIGAQNSNSGDKNFIRGDGNTILGDQNAVLQGRNVSILGDRNLNIGDNNKIIGAQNTVINTNNFIAGGSNRINGEKNSINGDQNYVTGGKNSISGGRNFVTGSDNTIINNGGTLADMENRFKQLQANLYSKQRQNTINRLYAFAPRGGLGSVTWPGGGLTPILNRSY